MTASIAAHRAPPKPASREALESPLRAALRLALAALDAAEARGEAARLAQALTHVAHCYHGLGMTAHRRWYLQQALRFSRLLSAVDASVDTLCELAEAAVDCTEDLVMDDNGEIDDNPRRAHSARDQARDYLYEATRLAAHSADPQWEVTVLLRVSEQLDRMGDHQDAISIQERALHLISAGAVHTA
jgi:tetratricopeptide (TPR) repeat protein